jgi:hypothetical protein
MRPSVEDADGTVEEVAVTAGIYGEKVEVRSRVPNYR